MYPYLSVIHMLMHDVWLITKPCSDTVIHSFQLSKFWHVKSVIDAIRYPIRPYPPTRPIPWFSMTNDSVLGEVFICILVWLSTPSTIRTRWQSAKQHSHDLFVLEWTSGITHHYHLWLCDYNCIDQHKWASAWNDEVRVGSGGWREGWRGSLLYQWMQ